MVDPQPSDTSGFDRYAVTYDDDLAHALSVSGEDKNFFARGRITWLAQQLASSSSIVRSIMDFGCGTGSAIPFVRDLLGPTSILGVDISSESLRIAQQAHGDDAVQFEMMNQPHIETIDLAFCNGVFHHIPPTERMAAIQYVWQSLKPGGYFALFENNPWNPATRYVMSRCVFDHDAIPLAPIESIQRLKQAGFHILTTRFLFVFPGFLKWLRWLEPLLSPFPLGTQYVVLARKSSNPSQSNDFQ